MSRTSDEIVASLNETRRERKDRKALSIRRVSLEQMSKRLKCLLHREIETLLRESVDEQGNTKALAPARSAALVTYLKLMPDLKANEANEESGEEFTEAELERRAKEDS